MRTSTQHPEVPPELENFITVFDQPPPEEEEISRLIHDHASDYGYDVDEEVADKLILALRGLSEYEITRLLNRGFLLDGAVGADDIAQGKITKPKFSGIWGLN